MAGGFLASTPFAVGGYMLCSACLLISNKLAIHLLPAPSFILFAQLMGTVIVVQAANLLGYIKVDKLETSKAIKFMPVALIFLLTIFMNMKSLQYANVETFMIFRFSTPLCISVADYVFLGRTLPNLRGWLSLIALLAGAVGYGLTDSAFQVEGYFFCALWYVIFCTDQIYLKHITNTVKMENWGRVYYSNLLAAIPLVIPFLLNASELEAVQSMTADGFLALSVSVILGAAMSYFAWMARSLLAATSFTIVGNVCKILTIVINVVIWDKHASLFGVACLLFCLAAAFGYEQAPMRDNAKQMDEDDATGVQVGSGTRPLLPK
jgi:solute carrier family 35 protein